MCVLSALTLAHRHIVQSTSTMPKARLGDQECTALPQRRTVARQAGTESSERVATHSPAAQDCERWRVRCVGSPDGEAGKGARNGNLPLHKPPSAPMNKSGLAYVC